jgi:hypothetical protein
VIDTTLKVEADRYVEQEADRYFETGKVLADCSIRRAQVSGLRGITVSARRFVEIEDWLLGRIGRSNSWRDSGPQQGQPVGERLLGELRELRERAKALNEGEWVPVALYMAQAWARRLDASYMYHRTPETDDDRT